MWRMTVEDLITELQKYDPKLPVVIPLRPKGCPKFRIGAQVDNAVIVNADITSGKYIIRDSYGVEDGAEPSLSQVPVLLLTGW
jgi:hypothetical protein